MFWKAVRTVDSRVPVGSLDRAFYRVRKRVPVDTSFLKKKKRLVLGVHHAADASRARAPALGRLRGRAVRSPRIAQSPTVATESVVKRRETTRESPCQLTVVAKSVSHWRHSEVHIKTLCVGHAAHALGPELASRTHADLRSKDWCP